MVGTETRLVAPPRQTVPDPVDPREYAVDAQSRDGTFVHVRAIRPDDRRRLRENFHRLSEDSVYARFLGPKKDLTEADLDFFTNVVPDEHVGLVATVWEEGEERIVGVGRYMTDEPGGSSAEVAFTVLDAYQGRGIGTLLFEHLVEVARDRGVDRLWADMWPDNQRMIGIFERSGYPMERSFDGTVVRAHLSIG